MPIIDLQRRITEAGRIRIGKQEPAGDSGRTRPVKLETFRLTSADKLRIEQAAALWGGTPQQWQAPAGKQWEVFTQTAVLDVIVPPSDMAFTQSYELWSAGGCKRRCDGRTETLSEGPCLCDPDERECDIHTRLSVLLRDLPGLGVWRVDTQGYYAAVELQGAVEVIQMAAGRGKLLPARLRLDQRSVKRQAGDKTVTMRFAVPVLDVEITPGQLLAPAAAPAIEAASNGHGSIDSTADLSRAPALTPVPAAVTHHPAGNVRDQMQASTEVRERPRRKNAAQPVPATGIEPRTAAQARADLGDPPPDPDDLPADRSAMGQVLEDTLPPDGPGQITPGQMARLHASLTDLGFDSRTEREQLLIICEVLAGRDLTGPHKAQNGNPRSSKNLSRAEASRAIDHISRCKDREQLNALVVRLDAEAEQAGEGGA